MACYPALKRRAEIIVSLAGHGVGVAGARLCAVLERVLGSIGMTELNRDDKA